MKKIFLPLIAAATLFSASAMASTVTLNLDGGVSSGDSNGFSMVNVESLGGYPIVGFDGTAVLFYDAGLFNFGGMTMKGQPIDAGGSGGLGQDHSDLTISLSFKDMGGHIIKNNSFTLSGSGLAQNYFSAVAGVHEVDISTGGRGTQLVSLEVSAVPEPETYAMLLGGLGLVGAIARRRAIAKQA